ncbi:hypothetical protein VNI00_014420 [Paramarasmius palmivorus]|uniref:F-box protein n=1 Tax=Paramarasmius palmivorus TaxID=297713 RepID=A0AAW0BRG0_9AGAR
MIPRLDRDVMLMIIDNLEPDCLLSLSLAGKGEIFTDVRLRTFKPRVHLRIDERFLDLLAHPKSTIAPVLEDVIIELPATIGQWSLEQSLDVLGGLLGCMPNLKHLKVGIEPTGGLEMNDTFGHYLKTFFEDSRFRITLPHIQSLNVSQLYDSRVPDACERALTVLATLQLDSCKRLTVDSEWDFPSLLSGYRLLTNLGVTRLDLRLMHSFDKNDLNLELLLGYVAPTLENLNISVPDCGCISQLGHALKALRSLMPNDEEPVLRELTAEMRCHHKWLTEVHWSSAEFWQDVNHQIGGFPRLHLVNVLGPLPGPVPSKIIEQKPQISEQALHVALPSYTGQICVVEHPKRSWLVVDRNPYELSGVDTKLRGQIDEYGSWEGLNYI